MTLRKLIVAILLTCVLTVSGCGGERSGETSAHQAKPGEVK